MAMQQIKGSVRRIIGTTQVLERLGKIDANLGMLDRLKNIEADLARLTALVEQQNRRPPVTYDAASGRAVMHDHGDTSALMVPLDYDEVIPRQLARQPFPLLAERFDKALPQMKLFCDQLRPFFEIPGIAEDKQDDTTPYWNNGYFNGDDARIAYSIARKFRPKRIVEIGSGNSTKFFRKAISDGALPTKLIAIDPHPRQEITQVVDEAIPHLMQDVPLELFTEMESGEVLFYDGSHLAFHGSDVTHFFLRVLPQVRVGVFVHIHDIMLPYEYPDHFDARFYNEQYVCGAYLLGASNWEILAPVHYLRQKEVLPTGGASFWMRRCA